MQHFTSKILTTLVVISVGCYGQYYNNPVQPFSPNSGPKCTLGNLILKLAEMLQQQESNVQSLPAQIYQPTQYYPEVPTKSCNADQTVSNDQYITYQQYVPYVPLNSNSAGYSVPSYVTYSSNQGCYNLGNPSNGYAVMVYPNPDDSVISPPTASASADMGDESALAVATANVATQ